MGKDLFCVVVVLLSFVEYYLFIQCESRNGLNVDVLKKSTS